jgi:hypothetical protein
MSKEVKRNNKKNAKKAKKRQKKRQMGGFYDVFAPFGPFQRL